MAAALPAGGDGCAASFWKFYLEELAISIWKFYLEELTISIWMFYLEFRNFTNLGNESWP